MVKWKAQEKKNSFKCIWKSVLHKLEYKCFKHLISKWYYDTVMPLIILQYILLYYDILNVRLQMILIYF